MVFQNKMHSVDVPLCRVFFFQQHIKKFYNETLVEDYGTVTDNNFITVLYSLTVSIFAIGGMIGALLVGRLVTRYGRLMHVMGL